MPNPQFPVNNTDIVEARLKGVCHGSRVLSVLHYQLVLPSGGPQDGWTTLTKMEDEMTGPGSLVSEYLGCLSNEYTYSGLELQVIYQTRWIPKLNDPGPDVHGSVVSPALPLAVSGRITKRSIVGNRHGHGTIHMPAVPTSFQTQDGIDQAGKDAYQNFADQVKQILDLGTITVGMQAKPVIFNRAAPANSVVVNDCIVGDAFGTERRRLPGRGV